MAHDHPTQAALFTLSGGGDTFVFVAPQSALDWVESAKPGEQHLPQSVQDDLAAFLDPKLSDDERTQILGDGVHLTRGSTDNDAALYLMPLCRGFDSELDAEAWATARGLTIGDLTWSGYSY